MLNQAVQSKNAHQKLAYIRQKTNKREQMEEIYEPVHSHDAHGVKENIAEVEEEL